jgi:acid phosphatase type 7
MKKYILTPLLFFLFTVSHSFAAEKPLAVYLTWQSHPESTMTVHWISSADCPIDDIFYHDSEMQMWDVEQASHKTLPEGRDDLLIHKAELQNLSPDTVYYFRVAEDETVYKFRTMPAQMTRPVRFIAGGDMYHDSVEILDKMNRTAASFDPMFALAGGDLAYAADKFGEKPEDFERWLTFLRSWQNNMITTDGRMVPIIPVASNEDTKGRYNQPPSQAPFFYALFAMPGKQGYNVLDFGSYLSIFLLDSGHTHPVYGDQTSWLNKTLKERKHRLHKIAIYHVPAFPSVRDPEKPVSKMVRKYWVPLFEKYNLAVAFENHDHAYKRSRLIRDGKVDSSGVLYMGDGGYGVTEPRKPVDPAERWYLAETAQKTNFVVGTLFPTGERHFQAADQDGNIFDEFIHRFSAALPLHSSHLK